MFGKYFLLFILYSFIGWIGEIILSLIVNKKFVNRGFLMGPYCPIYGSGCLLLIILLSKYADEPFALFASSMIVCSVLEYFTSWAMEVIFKMRWWDYTNEKFNINGRICLETMVPFGIIGVLVVCYVNPFLVSLIDKLPTIVFDLIVVILACIFFIDLVISSNVIFNFKEVVKDSRKDSTEDIKKYIKKKIHNNKHLYNRLVNAFPHLRKIPIINKSKKKKTKND